ncbi:MAG: DUF3108 domain-containing protein [Candidatus Kapabacteria bacterium]|jgi:hypothetical protein|nr:DUF3108 domain-containing protein [Candidatus Kapabacteria bacterium]
MKYKKKISILFIIIATLSLSSLAIALDNKTKSDSTADKKTARKIAAKKLRYVENEAYGFGETLEYKVGYKFITAGTGYFKILPEPKYVNGRPCYDIRFEVKSFKGLEFLYKVRDRYRTVIDAKGIFPYRFEQHIREGNYKRDSKATFDQINHQAIIKKKDKRTGKTKVKKYDVPEYVHDIVSAFYYVRTLDLGSMKKGSIINVENFLKDTTYSLGVKIHGKQTIEVEAGTFKCIVIEPLVKEGGLFKNEGEILIWVTDDDRKIPVKVGTEIIIGFVGAELTKYSGIRGPIKAKIKKKK